MTGTIAFEKMLENGKEDEKAKQKLAVREKKKEVALKRKFSAIVAKQSEELTRMRNKLTGPKQERRIRAIRQAIKRRMVGVLKKDKQAKQQE